MTNLEKNKKDGLFVNDSERRWGFTILVVCNNETNDGNLKIFVGGEIPNLRLPSLRKESKIFQL